jgi:uncharacterized membrane protein YoaK (UPF0700 family)
MDDRPAEPAQTTEQVKSLIAVVLTFASGATDVISYTRLGGVFTSVMTGNIILLGLAVARASVSLATHTTTSIAGYIVGVAASTWIARGLGSGAGSGGGSGSASASGDSRASGLPGHVIWALGAEFLLIAGFTLGFELSGANPAGWAQFCLLATVATAIGMQSATVNRMNLTDVGTTYLTGTLTTLVSSLVTPGATTRFKLRRFGVLFALAAGAALSGLLIKTAASAAPALPLAALSIALILAWAPAARWPSRRRDRGSLLSLWRLSHGLPGGLRRIRSPRPSRTGYPPGVREGPGAGRPAKAGTKAPNSYETRDPRAAGRWIQPVRRSNEPVGT